MQSNRWAIPFNLPWLVKLRCRLAIHEAMKISASISGEAGDIPIQDIVATRQVHNKEVCLAKA
jgi:hypothetical protein